MTEQQRDTIVTIERDIETELTDVTISGILDPDSHVGIMLDEALDIIHIEVENIAFAVDAEAFFTGVLALLGEEDEEENEADNV